MNAVKIFKAFLLRDGILGANEIEINNEVERIVNACGELDYLRANRKGARIALNRKDRKAIWSLWMNAVRHAMIEEEMKEAGII